MKKNWTNPELTSLEVEATMGGGAVPRNWDAAYKDTKTGTWHQIGGNIS